jgi:hypothetical protein
VAWSLGLLFAGIDSYSFTKELYRKIENEALGLDSDRVLSTPVADLVSYLVQAHMKRSRLFGMTYAKSLNMEKEWWKYPILVRVPAERSSA